MQAVTAFTDLLLFPFRGHNPWWGMLFYSLFAGVFLLCVFRLFSNPERVRARRNRALARLLELLIYRDDGVLQLRAFGGVLWDNLRYIGSLLLPMAVSLIPIALLIIQAHDWFGARPLKPAERALLVCGQPETSAPRPETLRIQLPVEYIKSSLRVDSPELRQAAWRLEVAPGTPAGTYRAILSAADGAAPVEKALVVGRGLQRVSRTRAADRWKHLLHPGERRISAESGIERVEVHYPTDSLKLGRYHVNWLFAFLAISFAWGLALRKPMGVEI